jgi:predicted DCC family thiol-disulfide oxidoreductase YuxK
MIIKARENSLTTKKQLIIFFDSSCMLCSRLAHWILKFQKAQELQCLSLESEDSRTLLQANNIPFDINSIIVVDSNTVYTKTDAIDKIMSRLVWIFFPLRVALWLTPKLISNWVYDIIAKNRKHLWPKESSCILHSKNINL